MKTRIPEDETAGVTYLSNLSSEKVSGRNMCVAKLFNQLGTLCSFTWGGSAEHKGNFGVA